MDFATLLQLLINGLVLGVIYALIAIGLALIFGVIEIVNFAHGELYMLGAVAAYFLTMNLGIGFWASIALVTIGAFGVGIVLYELLLAPLAGQGFERSILLTLGLSMVLQNGAMFLLTSTPRLETTPYSYRFLVLGDARVPLLRLFALILALVAFGAVYVTLHHTRTGKAMRGVAQNRAAALMVGIDPRAAARLAVAIGVGLSGLAGAALAPVYSVHPVMGFAFVFKAFAVIIIGGLGNILGAAISAVSLGIVESIAGGFLPPAFVDAIAFIAMILILLLRPQGLFGRGVRV
ncbi:MAG TPA: branched-chain amino acid ABC transporter permease [Stellaceae bacterium]|nr:branched-chain amino acid ABC transporter permease [Stellaceae bacterium]